MKTLTNPWFILGCTIWSICYVMNKLHHPIPILNGYLTDAFAIPVIANLGLWFQRVIIYKNNCYILSKGHVIFVVLYVSLVFELILPHYSKTYTGDRIDVLLYIIGGFFFMMIMNKPLPGQSARVTKQL